MKQLQYIQCALLIGITEHFTTQGNETTPQLTSMDLQAIHGRCKLRNPLDVPTALVQQR